MAKTIDHLNVLVAIATYKIDSCTFDTLCVSASYHKGKGFYVDWQPGWYRGAWGCILDISTNPLTAGGKVLVKGAAKNNVKMLQQMHDNLSKGVATKIIACLFDQRDFNALNTALSAIAIDATWATEARLQTIIAADKGKEQSGKSPILRQWRTIKDEHPDRLLLFRCGDFYEAYEDDAKTCADMLGITLTMHNGYRMAGFPHHALDTYLPKLINGEIKVAIYDQNIKEVDASTNNSTNNNSNNSKQTTMANNVKAADLIGKVIIIGENAGKYTITDVKGEKAIVTFERKGLAAPIPNVPVELEQLLKQIADGKAHWADESDTKAQTNAPIDENEVEDITEDEIEQEVKTAKVFTTPKAEAKAKSETKASKSGKLTYEIYKTKKGKEAGKIIGFNENDAIYLAGPELHASKTWEKKNGNRIYTLMFGPRYSDAAKQMCDAINKGATLDECRAIIEGNTEALAKKRAEQKAEYLAKKAEREAAKAEKTTEPKSKANKDGKTEKCYTEAEVKARIRAAFTMLAETAGIDVSELEPIIKAA